MSRRRPEVPAPLRRGIDAAARLEPPAVRRRMRAAGNVEPPAALRRGVGSPALFGIVQSFVAASLYFALGLVADRALGFTWVVLLAAGVFFALLVLSYVEGASLHQERGGATVITRYALNELWSFVAGWAILLDYLILVAVCAFGVTDYAAVFWEPFAHGVPEFLLGAAVVALVAWTQVRGPGPRRYEQAGLLVIAELAVQVLVVAFGFALLFEPEVLTAPASIAGSPSAQDVFFAFTLTLIAFSGIDASSGLAGEISIGRRGLRRLILARLLSFLPYLGIAVIASIVLPRRLAGAPGAHDPVDAPMLALVDAFETTWVREGLTVLVAAAALVVLVIAGNAAMLGLSRLGYSLALNRQIPSELGRLHPRRGTPYVLIGLGAVLAVVLLIPADLELLAGLYAFGATLAFTLVHLSVCVLRWREPDRDRPFRVPLNVRVGGAELPLPALVGMAISGAAFLGVLVLHAGARFVGLTWLGIGVVLYLAYRTSSEKPVFARVTVPEQTLRGNAHDEAEFGSILVPLTGTALDDDIMQTAGRLAGDEDEEAGEGGAVIEALWVFEIPLALPLDTPVAEEELARARAALARAKAVGEEYEGVEVATATLRARRTGEAIVEQASRRGVEAIVLAAEEPTRIRGGLVLGGKEGLRDSFVGPTTRQVVLKAPCRVILTAPPRDRSADGQPAAEREIPIGTARGRDPNARETTGAAAQDPPLRADDSARGDLAAAFRQPAYGPVPPGAPEPDDEPRR